MENRSVVHSTFVLERSFRAPPDRVYAAFAEPARKRRWFAQGEHHVPEQYSLDFRIGGREEIRSRFHENSPLPGKSLSSDTYYLNIVPHRRIVFASTLSVAERCISASLCTVELLPSDSGTDLVFTQQAAFFEGADGPAMREEGWRKLLEKLAGELAL